MVNFPVTLNVYDMYWINSYSSVVGFGVYHSGVVVHSREHAFGGHPYPLSGVLTMEPKDVETIGQDVKFKETVHIGYTKFNPQEVDEILEEMGSEFTGLAYHLVHKNCNQFSSKLCKKLCGKDIPSWVNRLANTGSYFPSLVNCLPKDWLAPEPDTRFMSMLEFLEETSAAKKASSSEQSNRKDVVTPR